MKARIMISGLVLAALLATVSCSAATAEDEEIALPYQTFSFNRLNEELDAGRPVMVHLTADWCPDCHRIEPIAINTPAVVEAVEAGNVAVLRGDMSDYNPQAEGLMERLRTYGIPMLVIYPADGGRPIILRERFTETDVLEALAEAIPAPVAEEPPAE